MIQESRLAIFASGSGTNAEEIFKHFKNHPSIHPVVLLSNKADALALTRALNHKIATIVFNKEEFQNGTVLNRLKEYSITHIILAGFLWLMPPTILGLFKGRVINIHPSLLPLFGGRGMYGMRVHRAVKDSGVTETGITIHEVSEHYDEGKIIFQAKCPVLQDDQPETIAQKVHSLEYQFFPSVIESWIQGNPFNSI